MPLNNTCTGFIEPLDFQCLFINLFAGSMELFTFLAFIFIAGLGAYFKMLNIVVILMFGVFIFILGQYLQGMYFLFVVIFALIASYSISKLVKT